MKVLAIDHIALAVSDLDAAKHNFCDMLGAEFILEHKREDTMYTVAYTAWGSECLTLVHPDDPRCFIQKAIDAKGEGLHHMGIEVDDLDAAEAEFISKGGKVGPKETIPGVRREFVVAPKNNCGLLLQVMEFMPPYKGIAPAARYRMLAEDVNLCKG